MVFFRKSLLDTLMQSFIMLRHVVAEISRFKFDDYREIRTGASDLHFFKRCKYEASMSIPCELPIKICRWSLMKSISEGLSVHPWWRHQMETIFVLLVPCPENPPVTAGFPSERPVTLDFDVFFDLHLNKRLSKQTGRRWFETPWCSLWHYCNTWSCYGWVHDGTKTHSSCVSF